MEVRTYRKIHRWLGLVVGIQLLLWTAGGLFFSLNPIAKVRGETEETESPPLEFGAPPASPAPALSDLLVDYGELRATVDRDEAVAIARRAYSPDSPIEDVTLVTEAGSGSEYRERPLPAYRVTFDDPLGTRLYVSVERGLVTARRNDRWRLFDFLWMLHIMDYQNRDNFNTLLLQAVSSLGLVTVLSGFILAGVTSPRVRRIIGRG